MNFVILITYQRDKSAFVILIPICHPNTYQGDNSAYPTGRTDLLYLITIRGTKKYFY